MPLSESSFSTANARIIESNFVASLHRSAQLENCVDNSLGVDEFLILYSPFQECT